MSDCNSKKPSVCKCVTTCWFNILCNVLCAPLWCMNVKGMPDMTSGNADKPPELQDCCGRWVRSRYRSLDVISNHKTTTYSTNNSKMSKLRGKVVECFYDHCFTWQWNDDLWVFVLGNEVYYVHSNIRFTKYLTVIVGTNLQNPLDVWLLCC